MRSVEFEEVSWRVQVDKGMTFASRGPEGGRPPKLRTPGLLFVSDHGERRFLPMESSRLPTERELQDMPLQALIEYLRRADVLGARNA